MEDSPSMEDSPPQSASHAPQRRALTVRQHWLAAATRRALGRLGARLGAGWVLVLVGMAVFAPLLASSKPLVFIQNGDWSSPWLLYLSATDVILFIAFFSWLVLLAIRRLSWPRRFLLFLGILASAIPTCLMTVEAPQVTVHQQQRELLAEDEASYALWTPLPYSPNDRLRDQPELSHPLPPSWVQVFGYDAGQQSTWTHPLGTDRYGSDVLSKLIHASRIALAVGFIAESISMVIGVIIGALMGYFAGLVDLFGLRLVEVFTAIPRLFLLLAFVAAFDRNIYMIMVIIGATGWPAYAYFVRAEFLRLRRQDFVQAAIATATPLHSILFRHMLPNGLAPVLVQIGFGVAETILYESVLSFLGLGVVDQASWGELLNQAVSPGGGFYWWIASFPGLAIFFTVFAFNLMGESMRDAIDPHVTDENETEEEDEGDLSGPGPAPVTA
jgi:peptide/nickel transport system permease protein